MFKHSVPVPRLYKIASKIVREVSEGKGSVKQLTFGAKHPNIQALTALVNNTFHKMELIENLLKKSKLLSKEPRFDPWLAKILITELLWGKKQLKGEAKPIKTILAYEQILRAHLSDTSSEFDEIKQAPKPRYVRVNTLKISVNEAIEAFRDEGWILKHHTGIEDYSRFLDAIANLGPSEFMVDFHIPYVLVFPPKTKFFDHPAYKNGTILLQDKATCLSVHLLNPEPGATILDMCAAPGMKTTQTAAMIEDNGTIYAVERGTKRYHVLNQMVESSGAKSIKTVNSDTLNLTEQDFPGVEYILVDPSCSGSGITDRVEIGQQKQDKNQNRLEKLANLQKMLLKHAFIRYSQAKRVVYSTCSLYPEENEDVVRQVLETCTNFKIVPAGPLLNDQWINYGSPEFGEIGNYCLYAKPDIDLTSGFFVAVFERLQPGERNPFLNLPLRKQFKKKRKIEHDYPDPERQQSSEKQAEEKELNDKEEEVEQKPKDLDVVDDLENKVSKESKGKSKNSKKVKRENKNELNEMN